MSRTIAVMHHMCKECPFSKGSILTHAQRRAFVKDMLTTDRFAECHCVTAARRKRKDLPTYCCCAGFYKAYGQQISHLREAEAGGTLVFFDGDDLPGLVESQLVMWGDPFWI